MCQCRFGPAKAFCGKQAIRPVITENGERFIFSKKKKWGKGRQAKVRRKLVDERFSMVGQPSVVARNVVSRECWPRMLAAPNRPDCAMFVADHCVLQAFNRNVWVGRRELMGEKRLLGGEGKEGKFCGVEGEWPPRTSQRAAMRPL